MYHRRPVRKTVFSYIMPFTVILAIFLVVVLGWQILNNVFGSTNNPDLQNERIFMTIEKGSVKAMTTEINQWQNAPDKINLFRGESVKTGIDSQATFTYFDQSMMRLNSSSEANFAVLNKKKGVYTIKTNLKEGEAWIKVENILNPKSSFSIDTDLLNIDTKGGTLAIEAPGTVRMIKGEAQIGIKENDAIVKAISLGVGQQIKVTPESIKQIQTGESIEMISALEDEFKNTDWYLWNRGKDGTISAFEESDTAGVSTNTPTSSTTNSSPASAGLEGLKLTSAVNSTPTPGTNTVISKVVYVTSPSLKTVTNKESLTVSGYYDPKSVSAVWVNNQQAILDPNKNVWMVSSVKLIKEGENTLKISAQDQDKNIIPLDNFLITYDKTPPSAPVIEGPGKNDSTVTVETPEQVIKGSVSSDTHAVIVNDYILGLYIPGSKSFQYYAKASYGNLIAGNNQYVIYTEDKAGNRSAASTITLVISAEKIESAQKEAKASAPASDSTSAETPKTTEAPTAAEKTTVQGSVIAITSPNQGEDHSTTETFFELSGPADTKVAKIIVNDYTLSAYKPGEGKWSYRASTRLGNAQPDQANRYTATAYDASGTKLGEDSITITVIVDKLSTPVISIPTTSTTYSTNLNVIPLGGTVSGGAEKVYLNSEPIEYEAGTGKWRKSVTLTPGSNVFKIHATKGDQKSETATITIKYLP